MIDAQLVLDESGYGQKGPTEAFVFAGFLASVPEWEEFTHLWTPVMEEEPAWTAKKLKAKRGTKNNPRILRLVKALSENKIQRAQLRIPHDDFDLVIKQQVPHWIANGEVNDDAAWKLGNPYYFAFFAFLLQAFAKLRTLEGGAKIDVIYDENLEQRAKLEQGYRDMLASPIQTETREFLRKQPRPQNDDDFKPLQAADLIAWHTHRAYVEEKNGGAHIDAVWSALQNLPIAFDETWDANDLRFAIRGSH